ncbi:hypothetical protein DSCA_55910 [Desulfosarcina alkanivorans]|uniref:Uncharacterized protein n=1 Tax=Desulfosarcina alkanivorans TaxID=571177 RepID=A0A5K7YX41_9BACT|nr:DUF58 domain-containing protein [Desulfosarcina alkanivorans]BBO71661.1 hypothetical protein DSCA_55910 [Desulfosarcina alkanivorans]
MTAAIARTFYRFVGGNTTVPVTLGLRNIYILPTGYGLLYLTVVAAMLVGSINYNNNLGFLLTFLLGSLGLTAMMYTYAMLYGLRLTAAAAMPVFAGAPVEIDITVAGIERPRTRLRWFFSAADQVVANIGHGEGARILVRAATDQRGLLDPGWLRITCEYPLGLFKAWARIDTGLKCLVYPRPVAGPAPVAAASRDSGGGDNARESGVDDFKGLSAYQPGDPPARIHWQAFSRGRGLHTKTFAGQADAGLLLDIADIREGDTERKLSVLCFHVLQAHHRRGSYALRLGGPAIPAGNGRGHRDRCLRALALYGKS